MTSSAFIFPDPAVTPEFTATNGITYVYDLVDGKWTVKNVSSSTEFLTTTGGTISADGGSQSSSGNLIIKESSTNDQAGRLYLKGADNTTNISLYSAGGGIDMKGNLSFNSTNTNRNIRAYGATNPNLKFLVGPNASNLFEQMSIDTNYVTVNRLVNTTSTQFQDSISFTKGDTQNITLSQNTKIKLQPTVYAGGAQGNATNGYFEIGVRDTSQAYMTPPYRIDLGTGYETNIEAPKVTRMFLNNGGFYFYKNSGSSSPAANILTIFNRNGNGMEAWAPIRASVYSGDKPGITISAEHNTTSTWNTPKAGQLSFQTWTDNSSSQSANANGGKTGVTVGPNHSSPSFILTMEPKDVSQYQVFTNTYSPAYGKRMYIYPDYTNPNVPDETPVTIGYLKQNGLITTATFSSTAGPVNDDGDPTTVLTQSNVSIPAQLELDGRTTVGRGFTLQGSTVAAPTNTSATCLNLYHPVTAAAQLLYNGDTTSDNACVQTKASTLTLTQGHNNTFTGTNKFHNTVEIGTSSTGQLVDIFNVLRVRANSNNELSGFNNGAISVSDKTGATTAGLYDEGLYSKKKLVFDNTAATQDILLKGADKKGLNIKYTSNYGEYVVAKFDPDGSTLCSTLDMELHKITNLAAPTTVNDAARLTDVTSSVTSLKSTLHAAVNGAADFAALKAALLAALA